MVHCLPHLWLLVITYTDNNPFLKCVIVFIIRDFIHISCKQRKLDVSHISAGVARYFVRSVE